MKLDSERTKDLDHAWLDALLQETFSYDPGIESRRIEQLFLNAEFKLPELRSDTHLQSNLLRRWIPFAIAASIALAIGSWAMFSSPNPRASAAVARSLQAVPLAREYLIEIQSTSRAGDEVSKSARLFVDGGERFVVHRRGWLGLADIWFGSDGTNQWFVPRIGPAVQGSGRLFASWFTKKDPTAPYLHIQTILQRMENGYRLSMLPESKVAPVNDMDEVICERVLGELKDVGNHRYIHLLPLKIELWADKKSGIAHRVILDWHQELNRIGPKRWTMDLQGFPSLPKDWFEPAGHLGSGQRLLSLSSESELDAFPKARIEQEVE